MQDPTPLCQHRVTGHPLPDGVHVERDVPIRLADGTTLRADVYRPDSPGTRHPVLVSVTPYGKNAGVGHYPVDFDELAAADNYAGVLEVSECTSFEAPDPGYWVPHGYALVVVDSRGCFASEGRVRILPRRAAADAAEVVEWAAGQEWSTGRIGMAGASHLATIQWFTAALHPPHLAAIAPWEGISDPFGDTLNHGGIPETRFGEYWYRAMCAGAANRPLPLRWIEPRLLRSFPTRYRRILGPPDLENVTVPAFVGASWSDQGPRTRGSINGYTRLGSRDKWLYTHGRKIWQTFYSADAVDMQRRFFDHFLRDADNGFDRVPRVRLETRHDLRGYSERFESDWPVPSTRYVPLYLEHDPGGESGRLVAACPAEPAGARTFPVAGDVLTFTHTFTEDTEVSGHTALRLWVQAKDAKDMDLFVRLDKIDASGEEVSFEGHAGSEAGGVAHGCIRVSHRCLDTEASTAYRPVVDPTRYRPLLPGQIVPVDIEILPHSTFFEAGSSLVLVVAGHDLDATPGSGHDCTVNQGFHIVHAGGRFDSHLLLPAVPAPAVPVPAESAAEPVPARPAAPPDPAAMPIAWGNVLARPRS